MEILCLVKIQIQKNRIEPETFCSEVQHPSHKAIDTTAIPPLSRIKLINIVDLNRFVWRQDEASVYDVRPGQKWVTQQEGGYGNDKVVYNIFQNNEVRQLCTKCITFYGIITCHMKRYRKGFYFKNYMIDNKMAKKKKKIELISAQVFTKRLQVSSFDVMYENVRVEGNL